MELLNRPGHGLYRLPPDTMYCHSIALAYVHNYRGIAARAETNTAMTYEVLQMLVAATMCDRS